jgi:DNA-binding GntR family transcriptional regulator
VSREDFDPRSTADRLADHLLDRIAGGEFARHEFMPTVRALAAEYSVSFSTVQRAITIVRTKGYLTTERGRGSVVR